MQNILFDFIYLCSFFVAFVFLALYLILRMFIFTCWVFNDYEEMKNFENELSKVSHFFIPSSIIIIILALFVFK